MAGSVNKVILVGNLGADPEIRRTQDGRPICNLRLATSENWRDKSTGERREKTEWHRVVIFSEPLCKVAEQFLRKGSKVYIEGALQTRKWEDQNGQERFSTEIVLQGFNATMTMLDGRAGAPGGMNEDGGQYDGGGSSGGGGYGGGGSSGGGSGGYGSGGNSSGGSGGGGSSRGSGGGSSGSARKREDAPSFDKELDDEIPF